MYDQYARRMLQRDVPLRDTAAAPAAKFLVAAFVCVCLHIDSWRCEAVGRLQAE